MNPIVHSARLDTVVTYCLVENMSCVENDSLPAGFHDNSRPKKIFMCC